MTSIEEIINMSDKYQKLVLAIVVALLLLPAVQLSPAAATPVQSDFMGQSVPRGALTQLQGKAGCINSDGSEHCGLGRALLHAAEISISPDGRNIYVSSGNREFFEKTFHKMAVFRRDPVTGMLSQLRGKAGCVNSDGSEGCVRARGLMDKGSVSVSPDGNNVYVVTAESWWNGGVAIFKRDPATGTLTQLEGKAGCINNTGSWGCAQARGLEGAISATVTPDGQNTYIASHDASAVAVFKRNHVTGELTQLKGDKGCVSMDGWPGCAIGRGLGSAWSPVVSLDGKNVYVTGAGGISNALAIFSRNAANGELTQLDGKQGCWSGFGRDQTSDSGRNGENCSLGRALWAAEQVAISPDGESIYVASGISHGVAVFKREPAYGSLVQLQREAGCVVSRTWGGGPGDEDCAKGRGLEYATAVAVSPDGNSVYTSSWGVGEVAAFDRNHFDGSLSQLRGKAGCIGAKGSREGCSFGRGLTTATSVVTSPDSRNVYMAAYGSNAVAIFARNTGDN